MRRHHRNQYHAHQRLSNLRHHAAQHVRIGREVMPIALLASQRARIVARLIAAERALPDAPDLAAVRLDGIMSELLHHWSHSAGNAPGDDSVALQKLEACAPMAFWRLRLAFKAPNVAAKIVHCWALLDALTNPETTHQIATHEIRHHLARKDSTRHVS